MQSKRSKYMIMGCKCGAVLVFVLYSYFARADSIASDNEAESALSTDAYDVAKRTLAGDSEKVKASRKKYDLNRVHIETEVLYNVKTGDDTGSFGHAFKGVDPKILLSGIDFYRHVERDDLVRRYKGRQRWRQSLIWGGVLITFASPIITTTRLVLAARKNDDSSDSDASRTAAYVSTGGMIAGITLWVIGAKLSRRIMGVEEMGQVAREYNAMLRKRLGLTESDVSSAISDEHATYAAAYDMLEDRRREQKPLFDLTLVPAVMPTFAGINARLSF